MRKGFHFDEEEDCVARPRDRPGRSAAHGRRRPRGRARRAGRRQVRARGRLRRRARVRGREEQRAAPVARQVRQGRHRPRGHPQSRRHPGHRRRPEAGHKHRAQLRGRRVRHPGRLPRVVHPDRAGRLHLPLHRQHQGPEDRPEVHLVAHHLRRGPGPVPGAVPGQGAERRAAQHPPGPRGPAARPGGGRLRPAEAGVGTMGRAAIGRRLIVVAALAGTALLLAAPAAGAHALLRSSDPASGASVGKAPAKVTLNFTEAPDPALSSVHVLDSTGKAVEQGRAHAVPGRPLALEVAVGQLGNGAYTVSWRVVSRSDGHLTAGAFAFGVGVQAPSAVSGGGPAAVASPSPSPLAVAGRWALDWGLILLVGAAAGGLLVFRRRAAGLPLPLLGGALALAAAGLAASGAAEHSRVGVSLGELLRSSTGGKLLVQAAALVATAVALVAVARWPRRPELVALLGLGAAGAMLAHVAAGHAAGQGSLAPLNLLAQWVHLLAVGAWAGGFLWLLLRLRGAPAPDPAPARAPLPARTAAAAGSGVVAPTAAAGGPTPEPAPEPEAEAERVAAVQRFSRLATVALGLVLLTGLARALVEVGSWHGLVSTSFGRTLMVKGALVAALTSLGAVNRFRIVPALRAGRARVATLGATVRAELAVVVPVVLAAALLGELPPAEFVTQTSRSPAPAAVTVSGSDFATTTRVELTATPGSVGSNQFTAKVVDHDSGQPVPASRVSLRFTLPGRPEVGASTLELTRAADGRWQGRGILSIAGRWSVSGLVERPGGGVTVPLALEPRSAPQAAQQVKVSQVPGQPTVYTISLAQGGTLQAYLDPGKPGRNVLHLTYFTAAGAELPIASARATATTPSGATGSLSLNRFSSGHFVSNLDLVPGRWSFSVDATAKAGAAASAHFEQVIQQ